MLDSKNQKKTDQQIEEMNSILQQLSESNSRYDELRHQTRVLVTAINNLDDYWLECGEGSVFRAYLEAVVTHAAVLSRKLSFKGVFPPSIEISEEEGE